MKIRNISDILKLDCGGLDFSSNSTPYLIKNLERDYWRYDYLGDKTARSGAEEFKEIMTCICETEVDFGKYKGSKIGDLPDDYVNWMFWQLALKTDNMWWRDVGRLVSKYCKEFLE